MAWRIQEIIHLPGIIFDAVRRSRMQTTSESAILCDPLRSQLSDLRALNQRQAESGVKGDLFMRMDCPEGTWHRGNPSNEYHTGCQNSIRLITTPDRSGEKETIQVTGFQCPHLNSDSPLK